MSATPGSSQYSDIDQDSPETALLALRQQPYASIFEAIPAGHDEKTSNLNAHLRAAGWPGALVAAALTQSRLRQRAGTKFGEHAESSLFTDIGLQQSTRSVVAAYHAQRFREAGVTRVVDLGCGLGADSLAFAEAGMRVDAVETDTLTAALATYNLRAFEKVHVHHGAAEELMSSLLQAQSPTEVVGVWLDPARREPQHTPGRGSSRRLWDATDFSPPLRSGFDLASQGFPVGMKLGPGLPHELIPQQCQAEWISVDGEAVELALWFQDLADSRRRRTATVFTSIREGFARTQISSEADFNAADAPTVTGVDGVRSVIYEPNPAVIRAQLVADLCEEIGGRMLDEHIAYFAADTAAPTPLARRYRVLEVLDFSEKKLKKWVADHQFSSLRIKKRGVDIDIPALRRKLLSKKPRSGATGGETTLIITRLGNERIAVHVTPLDDAPPQ